YHHITVCTFYIFFSYLWYLLRSILFPYTTLFRSHEIDKARRKLKSWARRRRQATPLVLFPATSWIEPEPYGRVLIIAPWNYPFRSEEYTSELQSRENLVCRLLLEKNKEYNN